MLCKKIDFNSVSLVLYNVDSIEIGIATNCECGETAVDTMTNIKAAGFDCVMISSFTGDLETSIRAAQDVGLRVAYVHLAYSSANQLWLKGSFTDFYIRETSDCIKLCGRYGIDTVVLHPTSGHLARRAPEISETGIENMRELLNVAVQSNVKIALENLDADGQPYLFYLLDNIDSPNLGLCFDGGHYNLYTPETDYLKKYAGRVYAVHLHDNRGGWRPGYDNSFDLHLLPGDGNADWPRIMKNLAKSGYKNALVLEVKRFYPLIADECYRNVPINEYLSNAKKSGERLADMFFKAGRIMYKTRII